MRIVQIEKWCREGFELGGRFLRQIHYLCTALEVTGNEDVDFAYVFSYSLIGQIDNA